MRRLRGVLPCRHVSCVGLLLLHLLLLLLLLHLLLLLLLLLLHLLLLLLLHLLLLHLLLLHLLLNLLLNLLLLLHLRWRRHGRGCWRCYRRAAGWAGRYLACHARRGGHGRPTGGQGGGGLAIRAGVCSQRCANWDGDAERRAANSGLAEQHHCRRGPITMLLSKQTNTAATAQKPHGYNYRKCKTPE